MANAGITRKCFIGQLIASCAIPSVAIGDENKRRLCIRSNCAHDTYLRLGDEEIRVEPGKFVEVSEHQLNRLHYHMVYCALANEAWLVEYKVENGRIVDITEWMREHLKYEYFFQGFDDETWMKAIGYVLTKEQLDMDIEWQRKSGKIPDISEKMMLALSSVIEA